MKIILAGPPHSGKSSLRQGLADAIGAIPGAPAPEVIQSAPEGDDGWLSAELPRDAAYAERCRARSELHYTHEFVDGVVQRIQRAGSPLTLIDTGGRLSEANEDICRWGSHAVLIAGEHQGAGWRERIEQYELFCDALRLPIIAELESDFEAERDCVDGVDEHGVFYGKVHHLDWRDAPHARPCVAALAAELVQRAQSGSAPIRASVEALIAEWQRRLGPDLCIKLGGSLVSDTLVLDGAAEIYTDVRLLAADPAAPELITRIESATGLRYRKQIEVDDWPTGKSKAYMLEGRFVLPGAPLPVEIEGCLRNGRIVSWHELYPLVFTPAELEDYREQKRLLRADKAAYRDHKTRMRVECRERAERQGLLEGDA